MIHREPGIPGWMSRRKLEQNARLASDFGPRLKSCLRCGRDIGDHDVDEKGFACPVGGTRYAEAPVEQESNSEMARR